MVQHAKANLVPKQGEHRVLPARLRVLVSASEYTVRPVQGAH